ncbi:lisH domain-containing protein ARMC9 isoform X2 [Lingula anatina]|uniref:LisH domain-containing protein ARMC9 n=2 Tax=Lingula anatina TaxID=7574 RepID=A0A1S3IHH9_LINAN|nr:lisH domain-containing protein ARMC9 isoform X2 [Lingula anatina]|eukprot:XP_013396944.1 lisH domain-containing protein ARMC9 isoform X2 [Lingula anatina]
MSGSLVAFESELNAIVKEYLEFAGYERAVSSFETECSEKGKTISPSKKGAKPPRTNSRLLAVQNEMVQLFQYGKRVEFFKVWEENLGDSVKNEDSVAMKLEFYLYIYFAIYPMIRGMGDEEFSEEEAKVQAEEGMAAFKHYLETRGASLSQTTEFLPFYALPFVPNPRAHPSYKELFAEDWASDLQQRLEKFLTLALQSSTQPRLFDLYQGGGGPSKEVQAELQHLQQQVVDAERRTMTYIRRFNKVQSDYHSLIGITADLVDSLEKTVQGQMISAEYIQGICSRLFSNHMRQSVDFARPGTAGNVLRQSIAVPQISPEKDQGLLSSLDYDKIKKDLVNGPERRQALLLQALRWRLTRSAPGEQRDTVLQGYIKNDILCCHNNAQHKEGVMSLLHSPSEVVRQYTARLFNALASLCQGRTYLSTSSSLLGHMIETLRSEEKDSITRENVLGALQKLSLRRQLQSVMIDEGLLQWLVQVLEDNDSLSDYTLEYSIALLMNLCLRTAGKKKCAEAPHRTLQVLSDLLGHENHEIRPYVNGALYSILAIPSIREEAKAMGMEEILKCFMKDGQQEMNRQFEFIIKQLNSNDEADDADSDDEEEDEDEEDQDAMEADLDKAEVLKPNPGELSGEKLLSTEYLGVMTNASRKKNKHLDVVREEGPLQRPVTPSRKIGNELSLPPQASQIYSEDFEQETSRGQPTARGGPPSRPSSKDQVRPPTRSGSRGQSRPNTTDTPRQAAPKMDEAGSELVSQTLGKQKQLAAPVTQRSVKPSGKALEKMQGQNANLNEYAAAFSSRPKVVRTPDLSHRADSRNEPPPQPTFSESLPMSRPGTQSRSGARSGGGGTSRSGQGKTKMSR